MNIDYNEHYDFLKLVPMSEGDLVMELAATHTHLAGLHIEIAFLRREEALKTAGAREQRFDAEAVRDAYIEKKWLIMELLRHA